MAVKLLCSEVALQVFFGKHNFTFARKGKYVTVIHYNFTSSRRFETSQKIPPEKEFDVLLRVVLSFVKAGNLNVIFRSFYGDTSLWSVSFFNTPLMLRKPTGSHPGPFLEGVVKAAQTVKATFQSNIDHFPVRGLQ